MSNLLERTRARGALFAHTTAGGRWGLAFPEQPGLAIHVILGGSMTLWASSESGAPSNRTDLEAHDVVLVRTDTEQHLADSIDTPTQSINALMKHSDRVTAVSSQHIGTDPTASCRFVCGAYRFDGDLCRSLIDSLPLVHRVQPAVGSTLRASVDLLASEIEHEAPGQQVLLDRLLDVVLVQLLRDHVASSVSGPGWLRASTDPSIARVVAAMHAEPGHDWTVERLARIAALSRSAFARRFTNTVGQSPMNYLTEWRMALATERLRNSDDGLATIAHDIGYRSEFAFAAAFKRTHGVAPGRWRHRNH